LVGSDGIWSAVRAEMYGEEIKDSSKDKTKRQGCKYSGYTVFAGETILDTPDYYETGYKVYIGPQRYFVTSDVGGGRIQWYAFFALPPGSKRAPSGWGGSTREDQAEPGENLVDYIKSLHEGWSDEVMTVLDSTPPESVEQRDLYDRAPEFFRSWAKGNVVLMGDAVHPMMPNLGQGGCQAIEDAYILTEILQKTKSTDKLEDSLQEFYKKRIVRVSAVQFLSRLASDLIINAFDTPWSPHDDLGKSWKSYLTFAWKPILQYVIFPLQFAYLYSYHPTGNMKDLPKALEEKWKGLHKEESQKAFEKVAKDGIGSLQAGPSFFQKAVVVEEEVVVKVEATATKGVPAEILKELEKAVQAEAAAPAKAEVVKEVEVKAAPAKEPVVKEVEAKVTPVKTEVVKEVEAKVTPAKVEVVKEVEAKAAPAKEAVKEVVKEVKATDAAVPTEPVKDVEKAVEAEAATPTK
jgi:zeaxanthin epoxidase